jgi:hypothetical protein
MDMRNKALSALAKSYPYFPALRQYAGSVVASVLMTQMDFHFGLPNKETGFYKFLEPSLEKVGKDGNTVKGHEKYRSGDSWCEHMGITPDEFRTTFDKIGVRYTSVTAYRAACKAGDPFKEKFYLSFVDRKTNLTWYHRNHKNVDAVLDEIMGGSKNHLPTPEKPSSCKKPATADGKDRSPEMARTQPQTFENPAREKGVHPPPYTEITPDIITEITTTTSQAKSVVVDDYIFPLSLTRNEQAEILKHMKVAGIQQESSQMLLDELAGALLSKKIDNKVGYFRGMLKRLAEGDFTAEKGLKIASVRAQVGHMAEEPPKPCTPEQLAKLPRRMTHFLSMHAKI